MSGDKLTPLQWRILRTVAALRPPWTLTGGAALAGIHLMHRTTRDLDLFWRGRGILESLPREAEEMLRADGLDVTAVQTVATFQRFRVSDGQDTCIVDLVAERTPALEAPIRVEISGIPILVDSPHEILVNKLCALLSRSELRDLLDVEALVVSGVDLDRALANAPRKDAGFSPVTLAWVLRGFHPRLLARELRLSEADTDRIVRFHEGLIDKLVVAGAPE